MKKWQLLSSEDISPSKWFPLEKRTYQMPNGAVVDDFYVTTMGDVAMIIPVTTEGKIVLIQQFKQGTDEIMIQFAAGRKEPNHADMLETAVHELKEETGISADAEDLKLIGKASGFSTKATEVVYGYFVENVELKGKQELDETENIKLLKWTPEEVDQAIDSQKIWCSQTIAFWELAKRQGLIKS